MLQLAAPFSPVVYFLHTILGSLGLVFAVVALARTKGSPGHVRAGWGFVVASAVAAITAILFSVTSPSPLAVASALMVLALVSGAVLALRPLSAGVRRAEWAATLTLGLAWLILVALGAFGTSIALGIAAMPAGGPTPPLSVLVLPLLYALFPTYFLIDDARFRRSEAARARYAFKRHLSRMAFALAIGVHAPIVSFADDLRLNGFIAFFGPFLLWPVILVAHRGHRLVRNAEIDAPHQMPA